MVKLILNSRGKVVDFDIEPPEGSFGGQVENCVLCGGKYNSALYNNYAGVCKRCWQDLQKRMEQSLTAALRPFTDQELKLLDEWSDLAEVLFACLDARHKAAVGKNKK